MDGVYRKWYQPGQLISKFLYFSCMKIITGNQPGPGDSHGTFCYFFPFLTVDIGIKEPYIRESLLMKNLQPENWNF